MTANAVKDLEESLGKLNRIKVLDNEQNASNQADIDECEPHKKKSQHE
jgi:hypothetical protein